MADIEVRHESLVTETKKVRKVKKSKRHEQSSEMTVTEIEQTTTEATNLNDQEGYVHELLHTAQSCLDCGRIGTGSWHVPLWLIQRYGFASLTRISDKLRMTIVRMRKWITKPVVGTSCVRVWLMDSMPKTANVEWNTYRMCVKIAFADAFKKQFQFFVLSFAMLWERVSENESGRDSQTNKQKGVLWARNPIELQLGYIIARNQLIVQLEMRKYFFVFMIWTD